jgi:HlyD family type I secretion membrane fusion protein
MSEVVQRLRELQTEIYDVEQKLRASLDMLKRVDIRAPRAGQVVNLQFHTTEGVIPPGGAILDIVPEDDKLIIEARLDPLDIDAVRVGLPAEVTLSAYNRRKVPPLNGTVILVSADRIDDPKLDISYYSIRVEVDRDQLDNLTEIQLLPGMPVEVMVKTGSRTALRYAFDPLINSMNRAFRED